MDSVIKVFLVDESSPYRRFLQDGLSSYKNINITGSSGSYLTAKGKLQLLKPDVVICDMRITGREAVGFIREVMNENPQRILVISATEAGKYDVMQAGAAAFMLKPEEMSNSDNGKFFLSLASRIVSLAQTPMNLLHRGKFRNTSIKKEAARENGFGFASVGATGDRQRVHPGENAGNRRNHEGYTQSESLKKAIEAANRAVQVTSTSAGHAPGTHAHAGTTPAHHSYEPPAHTAAPRESGQYRSATEALNSPIKDDRREKNLNMASAPKSTRNVLIAMGASTGGTEALLEVLRDLPADTPGIVLVQHMPPNFTKMFAARLDSLCKMSVSEAANGDKVRRGHVLVAPGDLQMQVVKEPGGYSVRCVPGDKVNGHRPSVDVLFDSVSEVACPDVIGVILTGMGGDGAQGMLKMKKKGAYTIGQDKDTCVVYGMPMVAFNIGGVSKQLPLKQIPAEIMAQLGKM